MALSAGSVLFSDIGDVLKEVWTDEQLTRTVNNDSEILSKIKPKKGTNETGKYAIVPLEIGGNVQSHARDEGEALGRRGAGTQDQAKYNFKSLYIRFELSGQSIASTSSNRQSIINEVLYQPKVAVRDFGNDKARQVIGSSLAGSIARCGVTSSSTTIVLNVREGWSAIRSGQLAVGKYIDIGTSSDPTAIANSVSITAVTKSKTAPTITISGSAVSTTASHYISTEDNRQADGDSKELTSLTAICQATGTIGQVADTVNGWQGNYAGNSGTLRSISTDILLTALNDSWYNGGNPDLVLASAGVRQKYYTSVFQPATRFVNAPSENSDYSKQSSVHFEGMPVITDRAMPSGKLFMLSTEHLGFYSPNGGSLKWMKGTEGILNRVPDYDSYVADAYEYTELGTSNRAAQTLVDDLTE
jgi:hypothetical protein